MTLIDIVLLLVFVAVMTVGFFKGLVKTMIAIMAFYLSIVLSSLYYRLVAEWLVSRGTTTVHVAQVLSFFILMLLTFMLMLAAGLYTFRYAIIRGKLSYVDKLIGLGLGVFLGLLVVTVMAMLLRYLFITQAVQNTATFPLAQSLARGTRASVLVSLLTESILPLIYTTVSPVLPRDAGLIFSIR